MRVLLFTCLAAVFISCNSSPKKDPNIAMDDTARMDIAPADTKPAFTITPVKITASDIPADIKVKGIVQEAWKWNDELGENIFITSYVALHNDKNKNEYGEESQTAEIYAYHYTNKDVGYTLVWQMNDAEKACAFDVTCGFIPGAATITDLDKDGMAEVKVQYSLACRSDVSPAVMKLNLHEGNEQYVLKGLMWLKSSPEDKFTVTERDANLESLADYNKTDEEYMKTFGRYESEKSFSGTPSEFLPYARSEWMKYVIEKMGE
ncbi:MAG: hypothetical protein SGI83_07485 [Bacteroidota bacterium]|nr:hypothetical protein [Bacteroidota bacterium]